MVGVCTKLFATDKRAAAAAKKRTPQANCDVLIVSNIKSAFNRASDVVARCLGIQLDKSLVGDA